jgi:hypothetical protein
MRVFTLLGALLMCASVQAQTVYRCGPDGRVYSQIPCPEGRVVDVGDERSPQQRVVAEARVRDDRARADALERERLDREALPAATAGQIGGRPTMAEPQPSVRKPSRKKKSKAEKAATGDFIALAPTQKPKRR